MGLSFFVSYRVHSMEIGGEQNRETKTRWTEKIKRAEKVGILFNSI